MTIPLVIHCSIDGFLHCFYIFAFVNIVALTGLVHVSWYILLNISYKYFQRNLVLVAYIHPGAVEERFGVLFQCQCLEIVDIKFF